MCEGGVNVFHSLRFGSPRLDDADSARLAELAVSLAIVPLSDPADPAEVALDFPAAAVEARDSAVPAPVERAPAATGEK